MSAPWAIAGGGPVGLLLALLLARRGQRVQVYERRADPRCTPPERGRSINLALAARGLRALEQAGVLAAVRAELIEMPGRMLHDERGQTELLRYGQRADEVIWSVSRAELTRLLTVAACQQPLIELHFQQRCLDVDVRSAQLRVRDESSGSERDVTATAIIGADGAGSALRASMARQDLCQASEEPLDHDYKELLIPALPDGRHALAPHALHVWPRGGYMLIALPNRDGSFTATLFLPRLGVNGFESLHAAGGASDPRRVMGFFAAAFADVVPLIPDLTAQFSSHPQGQLATLHCWPWHAGRALLIGDAAHAIVPFHGQGLNAGFEDCLLLDAALGASSDIAAAFASYEAARRRDIDAIAIMALENYVEMRDSVRSPDFARRKALANALERRFPARFIPRYSMVMFHAEIPYGEALQRGATQQALLDLMIAQGLDADSEAVATLLGDAGL